MRARNERRAQVDQQFAHSRTLDLAAKHDAIHRLCLQPGPAWRPRFAQAHPVLGGVADLCGVGMAAQRQDVKVPAAAPASLHQ